MTKNDLFKKILKSGMLKKIAFLKYTLSVPLKKNEYINITSDGYEITLPEEVIYFKTKTNVPLFTLDEEITLDNTDMEIINKAIKTTIGRAIVNYILLEVGLNNKLPYINKQISGAETEDVIVKGLGKEFTLRDYKNFINSLVFLRPLSDVVVVNATEKTIVPPPDLDKKKKALIKQYLDKYGKDAFKDHKVVLAYEAELAAYYKDYLKDDPTYGITLDKKVFGSLKKRFISIGIADGIDPNSEAGVLLNSLYDGVSEKKEDIVAMINNIINGSFGRGNSTVIGGVITKTLVRLFSAYYIKEDDCGTRNGFTINTKYTKKDSLVGRYLINGKLITNDNLDSLPEEFDIRSLMYCKSGENSYCKKCVGVTMGESKKSPLLLALMIGGIVLKHFLAMFHNTVKELKKINKVDLF